MAGRYDDPDHTVPGAVVRLHLITPAHNSHRRFQNRAAGVLKAHSGHKIRLLANNPFATHLLDRGADILAVKELLGHESLSTTQLYTHLSRERLKAAYDLAHPHA